MTTISQILVKSNGTNFPDAQPTSLREVVSADIPCAHLSLPTSRVPTCLCRHSVCPLVSADIPCAHLSLTFRVPTCLCRHSVCPLVSADIPCTYLSLPTFPVPICLCRHSVCPLVSDILRAHLCKPTCSVPQCPTFRSIV